MKIYSIEMMTPESRIYLEPPLSKPVRFIKLLNCRIPSEWVTFKVTQVVYKVNVQNGQNGAEVTTIAPGSYSFEALQKALIKGDESSKLLIVKTAQGNYLRSNNTVPLRLTKGLTDSLGVSEQIDPGKNYPIKYIPQKTIKVYCDLVEEQSSYENEVVSKESIKIRPSDLLAVVPSQRYPRLKVSLTKNPINYFTVTISDEDGTPLRLIGEPIRIHLKLSF